MKGTDTTPPAPRKGGRPGINCFLCKVDCVPLFRADCLGCGQKCWCCQECWWKFRRCSERCAPLAKKTLETRFAPEKPLDDVGEPPEGQEDLF